MAEVDPNDIDQRLRALVEIAASQSRSIADLERGQVEDRERTRALERATMEQGKHVRAMLEAVVLHSEQLARQSELIARQGEQITAVQKSVQALERTVMEHGRHIDQQIDAIFRLAKGGDDHERRIDRLEKRFPDHGDDFDQ